MTHVDDFIDGFKDSHGERYARFFFMLHRLPAYMQGHFREWTEQFKLYCTYKDERYRITGASRLGDVWLAKDLNQESGYDLRVDLAECSDWSKE
jgi:hypothetical protein